MEVRDNKIEIHEKIQFDYDKATIKEASFGLLGEIADVINKNPQLRHIQIEGHASSEGSSAHNKKLSDERAKSVMTWLTGHGVAAARLVSIGFGSERPIADNATDAGREQNRRVEFLILEQDITKRKVEVDASGKEKVVEETHETVNAPAVASSSTPAIPAAMPAVANKPGAANKPGDGNKPATATTSSPAEKEKSAKGATP